MMISLIAAVSRNNIIGNDNQLLWHLPADLKHFKNVTSGHTIIMGRKTFESIGKALPHRRNIVVTHQDTFAAPGCEVMTGLQEAIDACRKEKEVFIIGGAEIYRQVLPAADKIYLTRIYKDFEGDTKFPELNFSEWRLTKYLRHHADAQNEYEYSFSEYERL